MQNRVNNSDVASIEFRNKIGVTVGHAMSTFVVSLESEIRNLKLLRRLLVGEFGPLSDYGLSKPEVREAMRRTIDKAEAAQKTGLTSVAQRESIRQSEIHKAKVRRDYRDLGKKARTGIRKWKH